MLLPLIECVPAPCQGAIVVEAHPSKKEAVDLLKKINNTDLFQDAYNEKREGYQYGTGCLQRFGVTTLQTADYKTLYSAGWDKEGKKFSNWSSLPENILREKNLFSSTDNMKEFFLYEWKEDKLIIEEPVVFVANYKALAHHTAINALTGKTIFASGTKTWVELARQGYWVQGSADALGFEWFLLALDMPLINIQQNDICILTHEEAAERWKKKGYNAVNNYMLLSNESKIIAERIEQADIVFWSSFSQFKYYGYYSKPSVLHVCCGGETAALLQNEGINPLIFPTIKSFEEWRKYSTRPLSVA